MARKAFEYPYLSQRANLKKKQIIHILFTRQELRTGKTCARGLNPLHPNISMQLLHTVLYMFPQVLTRRIWLAM